MTDEQFPDIPWDEEVDEVQDAPPVGDFPEFGKMQLVGVKKVALFASGERVELPDVIINGEVWSRGGMKDGWNPGQDRNNVTAFFIRRDGVNMKTGDPFAVVDIYTNNTQYALNKVDGNPVLKVGEREVTPPVFNLNKHQQKKYDDEGVAWLSDWSNLQFPALRASLNEQQKKDFNAGKPLFYRADTFAYRMREDTTNLDDKGNPRKYYDRYRHNFTVFGTEAELNVAREVYKNEQGIESNGAEPDLSIFPKDWTLESVESSFMYPEMGLVDKLKAGKETLQEIVEAALLTSGGVPVEAHNGEPVDVKAILMEAYQRIDTPEPLKADVKEKIEAYN